MVPQRTADILGIAKAGRVYRDGEGTERVTLINSFEVIPYVTFTRRRLVSQRRASTALSRPHRRHVVHRAVSSAAKQRRKQSWRRLLYTRRHPLEMRLAAGARLIG